MGYPDKFKLRARELRENNTVKGTLLQLEKEYPDLGTPDPKTLYNWCNDPLLIKLSTNGEFQELDKSVNAVSALIQNHYEQLAEIAREMLGDLSNVQNFGENKFLCYGLESEPGFNSRVLSREKLTEWLQNGMIATSNRNMTLSKCLLEHIKAENENIQDISDYAEESPKELYDYLQLISERKTFLGKCKICKDW